METNETRCLIGYQNAGRTIIKQGKEAVIGVIDKGPFVEYVAWSYHFDKTTGEPSFYWGRYGTKETAEEAFRKKEAGQFSG